MQGRMLVRVLGAIVVGEVGCIASGSGPDTVSTPEQKPGRNRPPARGRGDGWGGPVCVDAGESCSECELEACEAEYCECYASVECGLYASCIVACPVGDAGCYQTCATAYPDGITGGVLLNHCAATACATPCAAYPLFELTACQLCLYQSCEPAMNACLANPECSALLVCLNGCAGDTECTNGCYATYPGGVDDVTPVGACAQSSCNTPCFAG
jgi:hypothetical protein